MRPFKRSARVGDLIRQEVADILLNKIKHKDLGFITVTGAKVTDDLRHATIYLSVMGPDDGRKTVHKISSSSAFIRGELAKRLQIKFVPSLSFRIDESIAYGRKIDSILDGIDSEGSSIDEDEDLF